MRTFSMAPLGPLMVRVSAQANWPGCTRSIISIFSPAGTDYRQQYDKALMAGDAPTVTNLLPYVDVQTRAANGMIADITPFVNNFELKKQGKVNTAMDAALQYKGKWYGLMDYIYLAGTIYNKASLAKGGGDVDNLPKTWDEFAKVGQKITDLNAPRFGYLLLGMEWNAWPFTPWVWSAGGDMVIPNGDGSYRIGFADEPGVDAAEFWHDMIDLHFLAAGGEQRRAEQAGHGQQQHH